MLSVIVPIYNNVDYIKTCVESILAQTYKNIEIILVNDGSTDGSDTVINGYANLSNVTVIHQGNKGSLAARLEGVRQSHGEFITFVDADDWITSTMYEKMMNANAGRKCDMIVSGIIRYHSEDRQIYQYPALEAGVYNRDYICNKVLPFMMYDYEKEATLIDPSLCTKLFNREILLPALEKTEKLGIHLGDDAAVIYPAMTLMSSMVVLNECFYFHRQRIGGDIAPCYTDAAFFVKAYKFYKFMCEELGGDYKYQIEGYYMKMLRWKERSKFNMVDKETIYYPFEVIEKNTKIVLYGAGVYGKRVYEMNQRVQYGNIVLWVDKNVNKSSGHAVGMPADILSTVYDFVLIAIRSTNSARQIIDELIELGIPSDKILWSKQELKEFRHK